MKHEQIIKSNEGQNFKVAFEVQQADFRERKKKGVFNDFLLMSIIHTYTHILYIG